MRVELNQLRDYVGRNLLCITHSDRPMEEPRCDINYLEARYASPIRLPPLRPFDDLRPSREFSPYLGSISLYDVGDDGRSTPALVCAFKPETYKPQHCLWDGHRLWVLGAEHIEVYDADLTSTREISDPWLAGAHTIAADGRGGFLVSCSASDSVLTVTAETGTVTGASRMPESLFGSNYPLGRQRSVVDHYIGNDEQLTHLNCAWPWHRGVLVSSLIQGAVGWFDPDGLYHELLRGFVGCHGARVRSDVEEIFFSDSCAGMLMFVDRHGCVIRRVGTGSRWLHDAIQIRGDLFAAAPFDDNEVLLLDVATRRMVGRIACDARGGPQSLSFGAGEVDREDAVIGRQTGARAPARVIGRVTNDREVIDAALHRQRADMVIARDMLIAEHAEQTRVRDAHIAELQEEHARTLAAHHATMAEMDGARAREVGRRDVMLAEQAAAHRLAIGARDATIAERSAREAREVAKRDAIIAELSAEQDREIARRDAMLAEAEAARGRDVTARDAMLVEAEATRVRDVTARDAAIASLSAEQAHEVGIRDAMIAELGAACERETAARERAAADHEAAVAALRRQIEALTSAVSAGEATADQLRRDLMFATRGWRRWVIGRRSQ